MLLPGKTGLQSGVLDELISCALIRVEDWEALAASTREYVTRCGDTDLLLFLLVQYGLLTDYQAQMVSSGQTSELILDNYRILDRLGAGSTGVMYKAEHIHLRRLVAIKVLSLPLDPCDPVLKRYYNSMRVLAQINHPNIVGALDAGEIATPHGLTPVIHYLATKFWAGQDLESYVARQGPLRADLACDFIYQAAEALAETHQHHLVHNDIKPSNILVTGEGHVKLLDFGLAGHFRHRLANPSALLSTLDYLAPEQQRDSTRVDIRADFYGLGGVLFWCLTGQPPIRPPGSSSRACLDRLIRDFGPRGSLQLMIVPELDTVITRLLAGPREERYQTPQEVMRALLPFLGKEPRRSSPPASPLLQRPIPEPTVPAAREIRHHRVLIVDDERDIRQLCRCVLERQEIRCEEALDGPDALRHIDAGNYDLILLDMAMPGMTGQEVCQKLRQNPTIANLKIILFSGHLTPDDLAHMLSAGADDYVTKPFSVVQLLARIKAALRLKEAQDRADLLSSHLLGVNRQLEQNLTARDQDLVDAHKALVLAMAKLVECRDLETGTHLKRLQSYCRILAEEAASFLAFGEAIDVDFIRWLEWSAPLHDIGKAGIPDRILQKEGPLTPEERRVMQTHTILGAETLKEVARQHGSAMAFLHMAIDVARSHHERYDGTGYPDQLTGNAIPLAARLLAIADVYDALRSRRVYKPALAHAEAMRLMLEKSPCQFDPALLQAFQRCAPDFDRIFTAWAD
jgi:response regulator RpfG family c-di-GMP phosphodiesterase